MRSPVPGQGLPLGVERLARDLGSARLQLREPAAEPRLRTLMPGPASPVAPPNRPLN
jgi:hypothetical protein